MDSVTGSAHVSAPRHAQITWLFRVLCVFALASPFAKAGAQIPQDSKTPPAEQILSSYQGQTVTSINIAGRPDLKAEEFASKFAQRAGEPFDKQKIDNTAAAIKAAGNFKNVRIQVEPEAPAIAGAFFSADRLFSGTGHYRAQDRVRTSNCECAVPLHSRS